MCWVRLNSWLVHDFPGRKPTCSLIRCCSSRGVNLFSIIRSYRLYVWHMRDIGLQLYGIAETFPGFNMAIIFYCLQSFGILFPVMHLLNIASIHLWDLGHRLFCCSTSTSSMPAALLYLSAAIPSCILLHWMLTPKKGFFQQLVLQGALALLALFLGHCRADDVRLGLR